MKEKKNIILAVIILSVLVLGVGLWRVFGVSDTNRGSSAVPANLPPPIDPTTIGKVVRDDR
jgi:hypothetical protein